WVVGGWRSQRSLERAARWDGVIPQRIGSQDPLQPKELSDLVAIIGRDDPYDVVIESLQHPHVAELADAGATWYLEAVWVHIYDKPGALREAIRRGPPG